MRVYSTTLLIALVIVAGVIANQYVNPEPEIVRQAEIAHRLAGMDRARRIADIFWPTAAAIALAGLAGGARWVWRESGKPAQARAEDGLFPVLVWDRSTSRDRLTGRRRITAHDPNRAPASTLAITTEPDGSIHAAADILESQWPDQIAVTQAAIGVQRAQAQASSGRAPRGETVAQIKERRGWYDNPPAPRGSPAQIVQPPALPAPTQPAPTLEQAIQQAEAAGDILLGQEAEGQRRLAVWKPSQAPHIAILGSTQQGKSSGAAHTAVLTVIRQGWRVAILDPEEASQWRAIDAWVEWAQVDGRSATRHAHAVLDEAQRRARSLAAAGAANISEIDPARRPPRLLVVIEEYAELRDLAASAGTVGAFDHAVGSIAQTGGKLGVHLMLISQSFRSANGTPWPATVRSNAAARLSYNQPGNDSSKTMGGLYELANLEPGQFAYRGRVCTSWNARPEAQRILAPIAPRRGPGILDAQPATTAPILPALAVSAQVSDQVSDPPVRRVRPVSTPPPAQAEEGGAADSGQRTADRATA